MTTVFVQVTVGVPVQFQPPVAAPPGGPKVNMLGRVSVTVIVPVVGPVPILLTVMVYVPVPLLSRKFPAWLLLTVRFGKPPMGVEVVLLVSLPAFASPGVETVAWLATGTPPLVPFGLTTMAKLALPPAAIGPGT